MRVFVILLVLAALSGGGYYGYERWFTTPQRATFRTAEVKRGTIVSTVSATGAIEPLLKVLVGSQVSGTVTRWNFDFNQSVKAGDVLAELDQDKIRATLDQRSAALSVSRSQVEQAKARLSTAQIELNRIENAYKRMAASEIEIEAAKAAHRESAAAVSAAEAQVEAAEADRRFAAIELERHIIRSPIDGIVISRDIDAGQTVAASLQAPTLFTIANDLAKMRVNAAVSETDIGRISEGMATEFRVDAYPGRRFRGVVSQVRYAETIVDNVVTYTTLIDVDNADLSLRPGMTATVLFEIAKAEDVLMVPNAALRFDPKAQTGQPTDFFRTQRAQRMQPRVFMVGDGDSLREITLELGLNDGSFTQVVKGELDAGAKVVVDQSGGAMQRSNIPTRVPRSM